MLPNRFQVATVIQVFLKGLGSGTGYGVPLMLAF